MKKSAMIFVICVILAILAGILIWQLSSRKESEIDINETGKPENSEVTYVYEIDKESSSLEPKEESTDYRPVENETNVIGLSLDIKNANANSATLVFTQSGGEIKGQLYTGDFFELEKLNDGVWETVDTIDSEYPLVWPDIAYTINLEGETEFPLNWNWIYGELPCGHYRIHKTVMDHVDMGASDFYDLWAEFDI